MKAVSLIILKPRKSVPKKLNLPADGRGTEYSCAGAVETTNEELSLVLKNLQHMVVVCFLDWLHNQIASLNHTAEEDECLR